MAATRIQGTSTTIHMAERDATPNDGDDDVVGNNNSQNYSRVKILLKPSIILPVRKLTWHKHTST
jgi:hypothetical protein